MHLVQRGPLVGFVGLLALLAGLEVTAGLDLAGWALGLAGGTAVAALLSRALRGRGFASLGPADRVTLLRAELVCGVTALAGTGGPVSLIAGIATVAIVLDGVDGRVARRTGTTSELGARFDMEVDAFLLLVLSAYVAPDVGWWVLLIGAARYLLLGAGRLLPWLHGELPPRPWCKVVAVVQGVVLVVVTTGVLPAALERLALAVALALLTESFGREVRDLWRLRVGRTDPVPSREPALVARG